MSSKTTPPLSKAWFIWGLGALLYLMGFFHRVAPAVMTNELMRDFDINAAGLGNLSAFYFYSYVAMQIPTGIIADTWGPRRLLASGAILAGIGAVLFAMAHGLAWAGFGRLLIGGSVAVAYVGLLKISNSWFPPRYYGMVAGIALLFGIIGAVGAGAPLRLLISIYGWRSVIVASSLITFVIGLSIWLFMRDFPHELGYTDHTDGPGQALISARRSIATGIVGVFKYANTFLLFFVPGSLVGCTLTFAGLWGVPFLTTLYGLKTSTASVLTSAHLVSWAVGGPFFGWFSDRVGARKPLFIIGLSVSLVGWLALIFIANLPLYGLVALLLVIGFSSGCMIITFAFAKESVPLSLAGTISGIINMGCMVGPMILQPAVGWILDLKWQGLMVAGARVYSREAYQAGFSLMVVWLAVALILLFFAKETHCRQEL